MSRAANLQSTSVAIKAISAPSARIKLFIKYLFYFFATLAALLFLWMFSIWALGSYRILSDDPKVWQSSVDRLVQFNQNNAHPKNQPEALFVGSSSIRLFQGLETLFINHHVIKNGFGGAKINDLAFYKEPLIYNHQPELLVIYIGINDILYRDHDHVSQLSNDLFALTDDIRNKLVNTNLVLLALRPLSDPDYAREIAEFNAHLAAYANQYPRVHYINPNNVLINTDKTINPKLFHWDALHLNDKGYRVWGSAIRDQLKNLQLVP